MNYLSFLSHFHFLHAAGEQLMGMNRRNIEYVYAKNPREHFPLADDKLKAKQLLAAAGLPVAETLCTFSSFYSLAALDTQLQGLNEFVIKPAQGRGGMGILVIAKREGMRFMTAGGHWRHYDELHNHIADIVFGVYAFDKPDTAIIEKRIHPHPFFKELYADGLTDVRIIVVDGRPSMCMLRVPTSASDGKANLHQGAMGLGVDMHSGKIMRAWHRGQTTRVHPDTGLGLLGHKLPFFARIMHIAAQVGELVPLGYLGVDIVVDEADGPLVLEINARPGLEIQNVCGCGLREAIAHYTTGDMP